MPDRSGVRLDGQEGTQTKANVLTAFRRLTRPLVKILIRHGVAFGEFAEILKTVYVDVAANEFALPERKISGSRVAILTGLTRKEVRRISEALSRPEGAAPPEALGNLNRATRVLSGWHQDPDFTGPYAIPLELPFDGDISFTALARRYSGDMPARAMLEELVRVNAVEQVDGHLYRVLTRNYIAAPLEPMHAQYIGDVLHDLAATIEHNFNPARTEPSRFERWVATDKLNPKAIADFRVLVKEHGQRFLEKLDNWLSINEAPEDEGVAKAFRTRVGVFMYEELLQGDSKSYEHRKRPKDT
jgi:hypothetical protein